MPTVLHIVRSVVAPLTRTRLFRALAPVMLPPSNGCVARLSGGRVQLSGLLVPSLVLHTIGAKSGEPRDTYLMYTADGRGRAIVAGTTFAQERHPGWTYNLLAHPDALITVRGRTDARAGEPDRRATNATRLGRASRRSGPATGATSAIRGASCGCSACSRLPIAATLRCERAGVACRRCSLLIRRAGRRRGG